MSHEALTAKEAEVLRPCVRFEMGRRAALPLFVLFVVAGVPALLVLYQARGVEAAVQVHSMSAVVTRLYNADVARHLADCPPAVALLAIILFTFVPFATLVHGTGIALGGVAEGASWLNVARIVATKARAVCEVFLVTGLTLHVIVCSSALVSGRVGPVKVLTWSFILFVSYALVTAVYASLWTLLGTAIRQRWVGLTVGLLVVAGLGLGRAVLRQIEYPLSLLLPGGIEELLLSTQSAVQAKGLALSVGWSAGLLLVAASLLWLQKPGGVKSDRRARSSSLTSRRP